MRNAKWRVLMSTVVLSTVVVLGATSPAFASRGAVRAQSNGKDSPIPLGVIGSFTGPFAPGLGSMDRVAQAWAESVNAKGGIDGRDVKLHVEDDSADPAKSLAAVRKLVEDDDVVGLIDISNVNSAWIDYVDQHKIPVFGVTNYSAPYGSDPNFFSPGTTPVANQYSILSAAKKQGKAKVGVLYCAEVADCAQLVSLDKVLAPMAGVKIAYDASISTTAPNYTAVCLAAKDAGANALFPASDYGTVTKIANSCSQQGYKPRFLASAGTPDKSWLSQPALNGLLATQPVFPFIDKSVPATQEFNKAVKKYAPEIYKSNKFSPNAAMTWAAVKLFEKAAVNAGVASDATPANVQKGLYAMKDETLGGLTVPLTFTQGQGHQVECWFYMGLKNGKFTTPQGLTPDCVPDSVKLPG